MTKVAFLISTTDYGRSVRDGFKQHVEKERLLTDEEYPADARDFKPFLSALRRKGATALGVCLNPGQTGLAAKQMKELGLSLSIFGCETLEDKNEVALSEGALVGSWFVTAGVRDSFAAEYRKRFGNDDVIAGAAVHYDIGRLLPELARRGPGKTGVLDALRAAKSRAGAIHDFEIRVTKDDQYFDVPLVLKEITQHGFRTISGPSPDKS